MVLLFLAWGVNQKIVSEFPNLCKSQYFSDEIDTKKAKFAIIFNMKWSQETR